MDELMKTLYSPIEFTIPVPPEKLLFKLSKDKLTITNKSLKEDYSINTGSLIGFTISRAGKNNPIHGNSLFLSNSFKLDNKKFDDKFFLRCHIYQDDDLILIDDFPSVHQWKVSPEMELEKFNIGEYNKFFIAADNEYLTTYVKISSLESFVYFYGNKKYTYKFDEYHGYFLQKEELVEENSLNSMPEYSIYLGFYAFNRLDIGDIREFNRLLQKQIKNAKGMYSIRLASFCDVIKNIVANLA